jgi:4a-hydroxytetrahydrobiopterin dehydratase
MRLLLTLDDIEAALAHLPGWKREGADLVKNYRFASYLKGIQFVQMLAQSAEEMNHHPDLFVGWCKVTVKLTTHSAGGITRLDIDLAKHAERWSKETEATTATARVAL